MRSKQGLPQGKRRNIELFAAMNVALTTATNVVLTTAMNIV